MTRTVTLDIDELNIVLKAANTVLGEAMDALKAADKLERQFFPPLYDAYFQILHERDKAIRGEMK